MPERIAILVPTWDGPFTGSPGDITAVIAPLAPTGTYITTNFDQVLAMARLGEVDRVVMVHYALNCSYSEFEMGIIRPHRAYPLFKKYAPKVRFVGVDEKDWGLPPEVIVIMNPCDVEETFNKALYS